MVIPEGYAQVNFRFGGNAVPNGAEVTLGVQIADPPKSAGVIATAATTHWVDNILPNQTDDIELASVLVKLGPNDTGPFAEVFSGEDGGSASTTWTPQVALLVKKETALGGRKNRGRFYVPGYPESAVESDGFVSPGTVTGYQANFDAFLADMIAAGFPPVVLHGDGVGGLPTAITALRVDGRVGTQRRRQRR